MLVVADDSQEYCASEVFHPSCRWGEVVVVTNATFGRMKLGRCVDANLGHLGCQSDVMGVVDRHCSGRQQCELRVSHPDMIQHSRCYKELTQYLQAQYKCLQGI